MRLSPIFGENAQAISLHIKCALWSHDEPNAVTPAQWLASANAAIAAIRAAGATTQQILVCGTDWDSAATWVSSGNAQVLGSGIVDPSHNFAFEVHQYLDAYGSGTSSTVVSPTIGVERLTAITQWAEATGNKLFLGEFGVASDPISLAALNNMLGYMAQHTDVWEGGTYWAAGPWWGSYMYSVEPTNGVDKPANGSPRSVCADNDRSRWIDRPDRVSRPLLSHQRCRDRRRVERWRRGRYGGSWVPIAAEQTAAGYDVAWKLSGANEYTVWSTDNNGNYLSNLIPVDCWEQHRVGIAGDDRTSTTAAGSALSARRSNRSARPISALASMSSSSVLTGCRNRIDTKGAPGEGHRSDRGCGG